MFSKNLFASAIALTFCACVAAENAYMDWALNATDVLNQHWLGDAGLWTDDSNSIIWWNSANILTTMGNLAEINDDFKDLFTTIAANAYAGGLATDNGGWLNDYYDDEGWWALAWIKAYDVTGNTTYLDAATDIFTDLLTGLDGACGGMWWSKDKTYVASIANELFIATGAALACRISDQESTYLDPARKQADWLLNANIGLLNENNTFFDGLNIDRCDPATTVFSYNQGVILGGLIDLSSLTGNTTYLDYAGTIAHGTIAHLADPYSGILTDPGYPNPEDVTGAQFKGIFTRNLMYLQAVAGDDRYVKFLQANANSIRDSDRSDDGKLGGVWEGPILDPSASAQGSALDCLIAAAAVSS